MRNKDLESSFEEYRRDRTFRRLQNSGPSRPMGKNSQILQQIEAAEHHEVREERLTREVHEFFADATRTAANIVQKIHGTAEEEVVQRMRSEIQDFLQDVIRRAGLFLSEMKRRPGGPVEQELDANMQNLVGAQLDEFRHEGTAQLQDKHIGQDPFLTPVSAAPEPPPPPPPPARAQQPRGKPADAKAPAPRPTVDATPPATAAPSGAHAEVMAEMREKLREAVQTLVDSGLLQPEEARVVYEERMREAGL
jgi:polyhydroxyalkanoate synthesis regulator phasin